MGDRVLYSYNAFDELTQTIVDPISDPNDTNYAKPTGRALTSNNTYTNKSEVYETWTGNDPRVTFQTYDNYGNPTRVNAPSGSYKIFTFDAFNNKLSETELSPGGTTSYSYDKWNRLVRTDFPTGHFSLIAYDNNGNILNTWDENNVRRAYGYDGLNRMTTSRSTVANTVIGDDGTANDDIVIAFGYNERGQRKVVRDGNTLFTGFHYNERGDLLRIAYPDSTQRQFQYDANGNRTRFTNGRNQIVNYEYDDLDRLKKVDYPGSATDVTYSYRNDGLRASMQDQFGTSSWTYNGAKQLTSHYQAGPNETVSYEYDSGGRRKKLILGPQQWTFNYDLFLRPLNIQQTVGSSTTPVSFVQYYPNDALQIRQYENNFRTRFAYDTRGRVTEISHRTYQQPTEFEVQRFEYVYDGVGNVQNYTDWYYTGLGTGPGIGPEPGLEQLPSTPLPSNGAKWRTDYTYDFSYRLTSEEREIDDSPTDTNSYRHVYEYDKNGNRSWVTRRYGTAQDIRREYRYYLFSKLADGDLHSFGTYDSDGNPSFIRHNVTLAQTNFTFDEMSRMLSANDTSPTFNRSYKYDGDGKRVETNFGGAITQYVYDGSSIIAEVEGGNIVRYHLPGVLMTQGGASSYYQENGLGSNITHKVSNNSTSYRSEFDAFGMETVIEGNASSSSKFRFAGKHGYITDGFEVQLLGARYYLPRFGRFMTQDPIGMSGGINLYEYCANNPLSNLDPSGTQYTSSTTLFNQMMGPPSKEAAIQAAKSVVRQQQESLASGVEGLLFMLQLVSFVDPTYYSDGATTAILLARGDTEAAQYSAAAMAIPFGNGLMVKAFAGVFRPVFATGKWLTHFEKHGHEFGYKNSVEYLQGAWALFAGGSGVQTHVRRNGDKLFYRASTNEFGAVSKDGSTIRTYFKPKDGAAYWQSQIRT